MTLTFTAVIHSAASSRNQIHREDAKDAKKTKEKTSRSSFLRGSNICAREANS